MSLLGNYIVSHDYKGSSQFQVVSLPENHSFLFDRKRIRCSADYKSVVLAKTMAEEELRTNRDEHAKPGLDDLQILFIIMKKQDVIKEMIITGQKRKSIYNSFNEDTLNSQRFSQRYK